MKKLFLIVCIGFILTNTAIAQIKSAEIVASGLTCSMCSKAIFKSLEKLSFVDSVKVNIETSTYILTLSNSKEVKIEDIKEAVYGAGFAIAKLGLSLQLADKIASNGAVFTNANYQFKWKLAKDKNVTPLQKVWVLNKDITPVNNTYTISL